MDIQTIYVAWYAAAVSTIVLLWDIYKWMKSGPKLNIKAKPDMTRVLYTGNKEKSIFIEVTNTGSASTTLTHLVIYRYKNRLDAFFGRNLITQGVVMDSSFGPNLPYELNAGGRWTGGISQEDLIKKTGNEGVLICGVNYTHADKPLKTNLLMKELE